MLAQRSAAAHPIFARIWSMVSGRIADQDDRRELVAGLHGRVLEIGAGDGRNFAFYPSAVRELVAVEPEPFLRRRAQRTAARLPLQITVLDGSAEALPIAEAEFDAVVLSLVLCSVADQGAAMGEIVRVLKQGGELRFFEHVRADHPLAAQVQATLDRSGIWPWLGGGCRLARDTLTTIEAAGFRVGNLTRYTIGAGELGVPFVLGRATRS